MNTTTIIEIVAGVVGLVVFVLFSRWLISYLRDRRQKEKREHWLNSHTHSIRGNLIRTYNTPIETDYDMDFDQELGKGGCGVVVVGEHKESGEYYAIKVIPISSHFTTCKIHRISCYSVKYFRNAIFANVICLYSL